MTNGHSFSSSFYGSPDESKKRKRPENVCDAIRSMDDEEWIALCKNVFHKKPEHIDIQTVLSKIIETDTVSHLDTTVTVWIDSDGHYTVNVYEEKEDNRIDPTGYYTTDVYENGQRVPAKGH